MLLGTIYMPHGRLTIDANKPIADKSAYTVLVVQRIDLHAGSARTWTLWQQLKLAYQSPA